MFNWLRRRKVLRELIESDARALIERFGDDAYFEARVRQRNALHIVDGNRPPGHWEKVKEALRKRQAQRQRLAASAPRKFEVETPSSCLPRTTSRSEILGCQNFAACQEFR